MKFVLNRNEIEIEAKPGEFLSRLLRERLGLTGTKIGCDEAECGSCTVLIDGKPYLACIYPAEKVDGKNVITIEGLADPSSKLHPLQEAFIDTGAIQCGFCSPGLLISAYALLDNNPDPSQKEIRKALKGNLCRCGGYPSIEEAVRRASDIMRNGSLNRTHEKQVKAQPDHIIGTSLPRPDAEEKVTGEAIYSDDLSFEGMLVAKVKRSDYPHAIIRSIDISQAERYPGIAKVITAGDIPGDRLHGLIRKDWPVLVGVGEKARYVGDALAVIIGEDTEAVNQALDLIKVDYQPLEVVTDPLRSLESNSTPIHDQGNLLKHIKIRKGISSADESPSDVLLEYSFHTPAQEHAFLEPECSIAVPTSDNRIDIYVGSQIPYEDRRQVAGSLGVAEDKIRIRGMHMGGGFGGKEDIAGQIHAALGAHILQKPVKLLFNRHESLIVHPKRHATSINVKIGATKDGLFESIETLIYGDTGAYASLGEKVMARATTHSTGPYVYKHVKSDCYAVYTNNPPAGAFRGFGVSQASFAIESTVDLLAHKLKIDPIKLRKKNILRVGSKNNTGQILKESVGLGECIDKVEKELKEVSGGSPFRSKSIPNSPHLKSAWGFAIAYKNTGLGEGAVDQAGAEIELMQDGTLEVRTSSAELGQGLVTVLQMITAEELSTNPSSIKVIVMDTDLTPDGGPTTASRQTYVTGNAVKSSCNILKNSINGTLSEVYDIDPADIKWQKGKVTFNGFELSLQEVWKIMRTENRNTSVLHYYRAPETNKIGEGGDVHFAFSYAAQAVEVEVNTITGEVRVLKVISAVDVGKALNPLGLKGQVEGGIMMGIGTALMEEFVSEGDIYTDRLSKYRIPSILDTPEITSIIVENPTSEGPYGAKGAGEIVSIPTPPAIANAVYNSVGVRVHNLPIKPEYIARKLVDLRIS